MDAERSFGDFYVNFFLELNRLLRTAKTPVLEDRGGRA